MKKILSFLAGLAALIGSVLYFFRSKPKNDQFSPVDRKLEEQANKLKDEVNALEKVKNKPVEDKSLEDEIKYWEEQNKGKLQ